MLISLIFICTGHRYSISLYHNLKYIKMKTNVYLGIAIRIIVICTVGMFWTYIPEQLHDFFGDYTVQKSWGESVEWGTRHYWYNTMMIFLFILSLANLIIQCVHLVKNNYDTTKW